MSTAILQTWLLREKKTLISPKTETIRQKSIGKLKIVFKTAEQLKSAEREESSAVADAAQRFESLQNFKIRESSRSPPSCCSLFLAVNRTFRICSNNLFVCFSRMKMLLSICPASRVIHEILEFDKSLKYYDILYKRTKNDPKHKDLKQAALQNKPVLKVGIGDYVGAARGYEEYAKTLKGKQKEEAFYQAKHYWELSETNWSKLEYYKRYRKQFGLQNPSCHGNQNSLLEPKDLSKRRNWKRITLKTYDKFLQESRWSTVHKYGAPTKLQRWMTVSRE